jgi:lysozyme
LNIKSLIVQHEGRVPFAYTDSEGYLTIGVGHLIDKRKGGRLPEHIIDLLFDWDLKQHTKILIEAIPWAAQLDPVRYAVLVDMTFNLGGEPFDGDGFKDWPLFVSQVKSFQFAAAASNMRATLWAKQVGIRAQRLSKMMETGQWPEDLS